MENILIGGEPVEVPPEVVTDGRLAVQAWHREQLTDRGIPFTIAANGDPKVAAPASAPDPADAPAESTPKSE